MEEGEGGLDRIGAWMRGYVERGELPGASVLLARDGEILFADACGLRDVEAGHPVERDTVFRIYSMTKPITSVAALQLVEAGALGLDDAVSDFIPSFGRLRVNRHGPGERIETEPARRPMTIFHLLTHTSGLTYGFGNTGAVARLYEERSTDFAPTDGPLAEVVERLAELPLVHHPGEGWNYGVSTDVLGRVVEVASGLPLDRYFAERILGPLGMTETGFSARTDQVLRLASLYGPGLELLEAAATSPLLGRVTTLSGGAGLVSTIDDYLRFAELLCREGELEGVRLLRGETVREMCRNHLAGDLAAVGLPTTNETIAEGVGLGVSVVIDPSRTEWRCSLGEVAWGGYASTAFWVDPVNGLSVVFMTQLLPSSSNRVRGELRELVYDTLCS
jgi:CubicO group peptidase (beta-lactamase class C family)